MAKISVHIVTYNSLPYLGNLFHSLEHQTCGDFSLLVIDNASSDGSPEYILQEWPTVKVVKNRENGGFARAHNQAIHFTDSEYVLVLNPDIIVHERFMERMARGLDEDAAAGSASGKLLQVVGNPQELSEQALTRVIDSTGVRGDRKRFFRDRGAGEVDHGQFDGQRSVLGASGAAAMYRRTALEDIAFRFDDMPSQYFDELHFSYKEDVDVALRLQRRGWHGIFIPQARAYHFRTLPMPQRKSIFIQRHYQRSSYLAFLSYRNHLYTLIKNESGKNMRMDLPWIIAWETGKMIFLLCTRPSIVLRTWKDIMKHWPALRERRRQIQETHQG